MKLTNPFQSGDLPEAPKFTYRPVGWFLQVVAAEAGLMTKGGIVLPGTGNLNFMTCRVVAAGPECKMCKVGDVVLLAKEGVVRAPHNGDNPMFIEERRVISIVDLVVLAPEDLRAANEAISGCGAENEQAAHMNDEDRVPHKGDAVIEKFPTTEPPAAPPPPPGGP